MKAKRKPKPKKPATRQELIESIADRHQITRSFAAELLNQVLLEVHGYAKPLLENDWTGGNVLHQLHSWMGLR